MFMNYIAMHAHEALVLVILGLLYIGVSMANRDYEEKQKNYLVRN